MGAHRAAISAPAVRLRLGWSAGGLREGGRGGGQAEPIKKGQGVCDFIFSDHRGIAHDAVVRSE